MPPGAGFAPRERPFAFPLALSRWALLRRNLAAQDYILLAFHAYLLVRVLMAPDSAQAGHYRSLAGRIMENTNLSIPTPLETDDLESLAREFL